MKNLNFIIIIVLFLLFGFTTEAFASWLFYHKPEFDGQILDIDNKEPIEGAVVEVKYQKILYGIMGHDYETFHIEEVVTDKEGKFHFSTYTTLINPFSKSTKAVFSIYKPGYTLEIAFEDQFTDNASTLNGAWYYINPNIHNKILEMSKVNTREERLRTMPSLEYEEYLQKQQKLLFRALNEERVNLGLDSFIKSSPKTFLLQGSSRPPEPVQLPPQNQVINPQSPNPPPGVNPKYYKPQVPCNLNNQNCP